MKKEKKIAALLLMAGKGHRFQSTLPKQFHTIFGKALYLYTLDALLEKKLFSEIILVCHKDFIKRTKREVPSFVKVIEGGVSRQRSSYLGLLECAKDTDIVLIHDGVRPFISLRIIEENIKMAIQHKCVDTCILSSDTIVESFDGKTISSIPIRKNLLRGQTPQTFCYQTILNAHKKAIEEKFEATDDCALVIKEGLAVTIVKGDTKNIKITTKEDLLLAQLLIDLKKQQNLPAKNFLSNKTYLIVGGSGGIGKSIEILLKKESAKVLCLSRTSHPYRLNLNSFDEIQKTFAKIKKDIGPIDGLINSAGLLKIKPFSKLTIEEIQDLLSVNFLGLIYCCKEVFLKEGGHIINIASSSYTKGRENYSLYSSAKAAVVNFTEALSKERKDLFINTIVPERTNTKMRRDHFPKESLKSLLEPEEVAKKVLDILKSEVTGKIISVGKSVVESF